jgi:alpha-glucosidase
MSARPMLRRLLAAMLLAAAPSALLAAPLSVTSPDGRIEVVVDTDNEGRASYAVRRGGAAIIAPSRLGFLFSDQRKFERGLVLTDAGRTTRDESWEQPWGEWRRIRSHHNELRVRMREGGAPGRVIDLVIRVQDDGLGLRYEMPAQPGLGDTRIAEELTEFNFAQPGTAWWKPAFLWNREEYLYARTPLDAVGTAATPLSVRLADGTHVALHEAALVDYAGMAVMRTGGTGFRAVLTPAAEGAKVVRTGPWATPWRTLIIADDAPGLYMSHLMLNLNAPSRIADTGWIRPGKFVGVWWNMIKGEWSWARGPRHGATTANVRRYIDFAATNGFDGVLVEGWNIGWDGDWFGNGNAMDFTRPTEDFDLAAMAAHARRRGVRLIGHHETGGAVSHYEDQLDRAFAFAARHGEAVVKTGYVTDAGQIERRLADGRVLREWHEGQWMVGHHLRVLEAAARHLVAIDAHEPVKGTGLHRTYPNWLAREGSRGMEYNAWGGKNPPGHEAALVFTRMLEGPMDFTPGIVSLTGQDGSAILSTLAKQLALYVVLYSPLQMAADTPEAYARAPEALAFIRAVPTDWEETRVLSGAIGEHVTIARKARGGDDWALGAVTDGSARTVPVTLDFLDAGRGYQAVIHRDAAAGPAADADSRHRMIVETRPVRRGDTLSIPMAPGGGYAVLIRPVAARR